MKLLEKFYDNNLNLNVYDSIQLSKIKKNLEENLDLEETLNQITKLSLKYFNQSGKIKNKFKIFNKK